MVPRYLDKPRGVVAQVVGFLRSVVNWAGLAGLGLLARIQIPGGLGDFRHQFEFDLFICYLP